jgi:hypothetical protein
MEKNPSDQFYNAGCFCTNCGYMNQRMRFPKGQRVQVTPCPDCQNLTLIPETKRP